VMDASEPRKDGDVGVTPRAGKSRIFGVFAIVACALLVLGAYSVLQRRADFRRLAAETEKEAVPRVAVIHPTAEPAQEELVLPGTLQAYVEAPIYARTSGYLKAWYHDIGSRVRKGDRLVELDTPEVDQQLSQARADLGVAKANAGLAEVTATRLQAAFKTNAVSRQEVDNATGELEAKRATVESATANVGRLQQQESFKHVLAPFDGVITRRNADIGTLVNAGNGGQSQQLFMLAQTDPLRVFVGVPERYAPSIHPGTAAHLVLAEYPGREFHGSVVRSAEAIDTETRTLLTEVNVANKEGVLLPGGYAQVHLQVKMAVARLQVPVNALLFRSEGLRVVVVDDDKRARLRALTVGRDYGVALEVLDGLTAEDWIVLNPADSLEDGQPVRPAPVKAEQTEGKPAASASSAPPAAAR
jgi:RND family efflux transporter MFP subunit